MNNLPKVVTELYPEDLNPRPDDRTSNASPVAPPSLYNYVSIKCNSGRGQLDNDL